MEDVPSKMTVVHIDTQDFAVLTHRGHISRVGESMDYIRNDFFPNHPRLNIDPQGPWIEYYDNRFNPDSEKSEIDLYIPISNKK